MSAKLLSIANATVAGLVTVFFLLLAKIAPDPYLGYASDLSAFPLTLVIHLALSVPFAVCGFYLWRSPQQSRGLVWLWVLFCVLSLLTAAILHLLWSDQFNASRGFGLVVAGGGYLGFFAPVWIANFLLMVKQLRK